MKQSQLVVSNDTRTWDKNNKIIFAGPWCFNHNEHKLHRLNLDYSIYLSKVYFILMNS